MTAPSTAQGRGRLEPALIKLALALLTGVLAVVLDTTVTSVALQTLAHDLRVPVTTIQWVTTGYLLALGMAVPVTGWLTGRFGGKRVWMWSVTLFLAASIGSGLSWDAPSLIAFRVLQGVGGGLMLPVMQTLIMRAAGGRALGRTTALISMPVLLGPILGPALGGLIIHGLSWRWIFWMNVPFCTASLLLTWRLVPADGTGRRQRLDLTGLALVSPGIALVLLGLSEAGTEGGIYRPAMLGPLLIGSAFTGAFIKHALKSSDPLVDLRLLRAGSFTVSTILQFLFGFTLYGTMLVLPLYYQQVGGADTIEAGLLLVPQGIGVLLSRGLAGGLTDRHGPRWVVVTGLGITALGTLPFCFAGTGTSPWLLVAALIVRGIGQGAVTIPIVASAFHGLDGPQIPHASVISRSAQQIGGAFGSAVLAVILTTQLDAGRIHAYHAAFWSSIAFTLIAVVVAFWLPAR